MRLPNLEKLLARCSGSVERWYETATEAGTGGFIIPSPTTPSGDATEPLLTLAVLQRDDHGVVVKVDMPDHIVTLKARRTEDGGIAFVPTAFGSNAGSHPPGGEEQARIMEAILGEYEVEKEGLLRL